MAGRANSKVWAIFTSLCIVGSVCSKRNRTVFDHLQPHSMWTTLWDYSLSSCLCHGRNHPMRAGGVYWLLCDVFYGSSGSHQPWISLALRHRYLQYGSIRVGRHGEALSVVSFIAGLFQNDTRRRPTVLYLCYLVLEYVFLGDTTIFRPTILEWSLGIWHSIGGRIFVPFTRIF